MLKFKIVPADAPIAFEKFSVKIEITDLDELRAITSAVGNICNGHGTGLYDWLNGRLALYEAHIRDGRYVE